MRHGRDEPLQRRRRLQQEQRGLDQFELHDLGVAGSIQRDVDPRGLMNPGALGL